MMTVFGSILFILPTSLVVCLFRGLDLLHSSSVVLMALLAMPIGMTLGMLLVQRMLPRFYAQHAISHLPPR